ncbi:MAG: aspartate aminotransferase family protein [Candidatus Bathyarchaeota archaeon]|nr:aspartate aminotransferase family protein [Candidatus Bathyarchaeota archaeon]
MPSLRGPRIVAGPPGPRVAKLLTDSGQDPSTYSSPIVDEARGIYIRDPDGNVFVDLISGRCVVNTGHNHPRVVEAVKAQAERSLHWQTEQAYTLIRRFEEMLGSGPKQVYWGQSGSLSNDHAIKAVRRATGKSTILSFTGAYHGSSMGAISLSGYDPSMKRHYGPLLPGIVHVPYASCYRCPLKLEHPGCALACLAYIEDVAFKSYVPADEVAAVFVEPVQGDAGWHIPPPGWHQGLKRLCERHGILHVADEVQTGFGRTGKWLGMDHWGVKPDVVLLGKALGSGIPISACVLGRDLLESTDPEPIPIHAQSFSATPLGTAAAHATMDVIRDEHLCENSERMGAYMKRRLTELMDRHPSIGDVRGLGLLIGVEIVKDREKKTPNPEAANAICAEAFRRGVYTLNMGSYGGRAIRVAPPLIVTEEQADTAIEILAESIGKVEKG